MNPAAPLLGFIGRLDMQKGVDMIADNYEWLMSEGAQLVLLGSGRPDLEEALRRVAAGWLGAAAAVWLYVCLLSHQHTMSHACCHYAACLLVLQGDAGAQPQPVPQLRRLLCQAGTQDHGRCGPGRGWADGGACGWGGALQ